MDLLKTVRSIRVDTRHGRRSPHKPLLLLMAIGRRANGQERLARFDDLEQDLNRLIRRFGLPDSRENAYHPFWHLRNDGLWDIDRPELVRATTAGHAYISDLRRHSIRGGLPQNVMLALEEDPELAWRVVQSLLSDFFPATLHDELLMEVGLGGKTVLLNLEKTKLTPDGRDRSFREVVLRAYGSRCAMCELEVRVDDRPIGLEPAHIKWHSAGGPACVENGIALCVLHHQYFDRGLFTLTSDFTVVVSELAVGESAQESLKRHGGLILSILPEPPEQRPASIYLEWHARAVFRGVNLRR